MPSTQLCRRFAPESPSLRLVHEVDNDEIDYSKLTDEQIRQLEAILGPADAQPTPVAGRRKPAGICMNSSCKPGLSWSPPRLSSTASMWRPSASICRRSPKAAFANLIINVPPGHAKSLLTAVFWPAWVWIDQPADRWLFASYRRHSERARQRQMPPAD